MRRVVWLVLVGLAVLGPAGCASSRPCGDLPAAGASRRTVASPGDQAVARARGSVEAKAVAETEFGLLAGGDYGGAWALWTDDAKAVVPRDDYVSQSAVCRPGLAVATRVVSTDPVDATHVRITWDRGGRTGIAEMFQINGAWRYRPDQATLDGYRAGTACAGAGISPR
jgi:hypothetical protein